ncbi:MULTISPECIES: ribosomal protein S18-alanine N-acetyltransferase [unclassified Agarivorans]|uniref:ribosomal protein S18-alanine N-acetyltransferase n=1 Tax=unclassified Agarivorans TaxID=2636026 RepID=UPI0026E37E17|nr:MULTISPECIES: ribosomal protein S18-alanine N-acetyltransferase [unclassified Agarivorans]MDO6685215.1 ribosomal protein S18-alanine N-acetyltransferase [Agarivorans sp. 3_MG-2023]MDO6715613.1 ribosomal protein S18-alanine N-acetyltransferase [Agarivorans sp. 2_MG-2023]
MQPDLKPELSPLSLMDVPLMLAIEQKAHSHPWSRDLLASNFGGLYRNLGLWQGQRLLAYVVLRVVAGEAELINIAVAPESQGQGLGKQLMQAMFNMAEQQQWLHILLEVRASNHKAQQLYKRFEFSEIDRRKAYYPCHEQGREDALIMQCIC